MAVVNNDIITQKDLNDFFNFMHIQLSAQYQGKELESKIQSMKLDLLDRLIEEKLILQEAKKSDVKIDENLIKQKIAEIKKRYPSDSQFQAELAKQGLNQADLENRIREQFLTLNFIENKIKRKVVVSPYEVTQYYEKNTSDFITPQEREFESVALDDGEKAGRFYAKLKAGQDLSGLAKECGLVVNKLCVGSNEHLRPEIHDLIFKSLKPQDFSEPVKIDEQYYIFRLVNIIESKKQPLNEVQETIYQLLQEKKTEVEMNNWLAQLKQKSYIKKSP